MLLGLLGRPRAGVAGTTATLEVQGTQATARLARRDTINGSLVSSFPQTLTLVRGREGWTIEQIGR